MPTATQSEYRRAKQYLAAQPKPRIDLKRGFINCGHVAMSKGWLAAAIPLDVNFHLLVCAACRDRIYASVLTDIVSKAAKSKIVNPKS
jgi:hypothetical protein